MISYFSPAKVNLFLRVLGKREDRYHELASLFQAVSLGDTLWFSLNDTKDVLTATDPHLPLDERNLILKAASLFRKKSGLSFFITCHLKKNIPHSAGLGGGSSNAATTLFALNELLGLPLTLSELADLGAQVGSDVPFFFSTGTAFCQGRGEIVENMPSLDLHKKIWIVKPKEGLSTPLIFSRFKLEQGQSPRLFLNDFLSGKISFHNDLEKVAFSLLPQLVALKENLLQQGFEAVSMTGSGTALMCVGSCKPELSDDFFIAPIEFVNREKENWYTDPSFC